MPIAGYLPKNLPGTTCLFRAASKISTGQHLGYTYKEQV